MTMQSLCVITGAIHIREQQVPINKVRLLFPQYNNNNVPTETKAPNQCISLGFVDRAVSVRKMAGRTKPAGLQGIRADISESRAFFLVHNLGQKNRVHIYLTILWDITV